MRRIIWICSLGMVCGGLPFAGTGWGQALDTPPDTAKKPQAPQVPSTLLNPTLAPPRAPGVFPVAPATPLAPVRSVTGAAIPAGQSTPPDALAWDQEVKEVSAEPGATNALISFNFTNVHSAEVIIRNVRPSCGCTTVQLPAMPWHIPSGSNGLITASLDLRGKRGVLTKSLSVDSTSGYKSLLFKVSVPTDLVTTTASGETIDPDRMKNMQMAVVDRQVVFKNHDCAECHAEPAKGKMGEELYNAACAICHDTPNRATMVPDLTALKFPTSAPYWKYWIVNGRPGSLMPAFADDKGGPLTAQQVQSLVEYLTEKITKKTSAPTAAQNQPLNRAPLNQSGPPNASKAPAPGTQ